MAENKMAQVAKILGIEINKPFRCSRFVGKYKLTKDGVMAHDGMGWFYGVTLSPLVLYYLIAEGGEISYAE